VSVRALSRHAGEERPRLDAAGVVGDVRDRYRTWIADLDGAGGSDERVEREGRLSGHG
jgi:hypothetical protein